MRRTCTVGWTRPARIPKETASVVEPRHFIVAACMHGWIAPSSKVCSSVPVTQAAFPKRRFLQTTISRKSSILIYILGSRKCLLQSFQARANALRGPSIRVFIDVGCQMWGFDWSPWQIPTGPT